MIPQNIKRDVSSDKELLSKYLNENSSIASKYSSIYSKVNQNSVKNHTIHISELMNSASDNKRTSSKESTKSDLKYKCKNYIISYCIAKISFPKSKSKHHKRVKSHHMINVSNFLIKSL